jgi:hypothetical protein
MSISIQAIVPRGHGPLDPGAIRTGVHDWLRDFAFTVIREMQDYPTARAWKNRPPQRGPRREIGNTGIGRRTGMYGRTWPLGVTFMTDAVVIENRTPYAVYVGGPKRGGKGARQTAAMAARGWRSVSDVAPAVATRLRPVLIRSITAGWSRR